MAAKDFQPLSAFNFVLSISGSEDAMAFSEASGINTPITIEEMTEGGENRFKHRLPAVGVSNNLVLKRGLLLTNTPMFSWIANTLDGGFASPITPHNLVLQLKDETGKVLVTWDFVNAWPVKCSTSSLKTDKSEVVIESLEFAYDYVSMRQ